MWSARRMRWTLWVVALLVCPVPYGGLEHGWVPPLWLAVMAGVTSVAAIAEGGRTTIQIALVFAVQALVAAAMLWAASALLVVLSERALGPARAAGYGRGSAGAARPSSRSVRSIARPFPHTTGWATARGLWR